MEARKYSRLEDPEEYNTCEEVEEDNTLDIESQVVLPSNSYISEVTSLSAPLPTKIKIPDPENVEICGKSITDYINEKVNEGIINNISKIATVLPTDISLGNSEVLVIGIEVGDTPIEQVENIFKHTLETFKEKGITKVVLYPKRYGVGDIDFDNICVEDKYIE